MSTFCRDWNMLMSQAIEMSLDEFRAKLSELAASGDGFRREVKVTDGARTITFTREAVNYLLEKDDWRAVLEGYFAEGFGPPPVPPAPRRNPNEPFWETKG